MVLTSVRRSNIVPASSRRSPVREAGAGQTRARRSRSGRPRDRGGQRPRRRSSIARLCKVTSGQPRDSAAAAASFRWATGRAVGTMIASTFSRGVDSSTGQIRWRCDPWWWPSRRRPSLRPGPLEEPCLGQRPVRSQRLAVLHRHPGKYAERITVTVGNTQYSVFRSRKQSIGQCPHSTIRAPPKHPVADRDVPLPVEWATARGRRAQHPPAESSAHPTRPGAAGG